MYSTLAVGWKVGDVVGEELNIKMLATTLAASIVALRAGKLSPKFGFGGLVSSGVGE
jgi:hypothetical protein